MKNHNDIFIFKNNLFENFENKKLFNDIKNAIKNMNYINLETYPNEEYQYKFPKSKPIKIVFMDNNWYVGMVFINKEINQEDFLFRRMTFIQEYKVLDDKFEKKDIDSKYLNFLNRIQNAMTLYGVKPKMATIKASKYIAHYFKDDMKKFFNSQKFVRPNKDGSVEFSIEYTQPLEILPFIKRWLPALEIIEPQELKDKLKEDLQKALESY
jgi:predicted DNA-binding transcriptional regulator YafY